MRATQSLQYNCHCRAGNCTDDYYIENDKAYCDYYACLCKSAALFIIAALCVAVSNDAYDKTDQWHYKCKDKADYTEH